MIFAFALADTLYRKRAQQAPDAGQLLSPADAYLVPRRWPELSLEARGAERCVIAARMSAWRLMTTQDIMCIHRASAVQQYEPPTPRRLAAEYWCSA